ncbi:MAG: hypothetical protein IOC33_33045 [Burkholderia sp.]|uniref:hypothetical protein n=1 Tax=Burkholderia sp. TaxID=36773 RepID=UPI0025894A07|nr:hypothetical protein [Burkholderia sp.]MCA3813133.1 hypothetical protein [Burkholderia sp.]MCA3859784.1 hypothetical protein [Burkholderia sp.]MCA3871011.1 hypothetical protein [Burkholderia sp.]
MFMIGNASLADAIAQATILSTGCQQPRPEDVSHGVRSTMRFPRQVTRAAAVTHASTVRDNTRALGPDNDQRPLQVATTICGGQRTAGRAARRPFQPDGTASLRPRQRAVP